MALTGVNLVDVGQARVLAGQTVVLDGDRIVSVGPDAVTTVPRGARRLDVAGRYLIPGLWDLHVHLGMAGREALDLLLEHGVTGVRDMGGPRIVLAWRNSIDRGELRGPRIVGAGTVAESKRWLDAAAGLLAGAGMADQAAELRTRFSLDTPDDARRAVDSLRRQGANFVKIRNYPSAATTYELFRSARAAGLRVAGHPPPLEFLGTVSDSGLHTVEHELLAISGGRLVDGLGTLDDAARGNLLSRLGRNHTTWVPTLVTAQSRLTRVHEVRRVIENARPESTRADRLLTPMLRQQWRTQLDMRVAEADTVTDWAAIFRGTYAGVRAAAAAGVAIGAGTDLGVPLVYPGLSLHDELEALVKSVGLTPGEAIRAATVTAAQVVGAAGRAGVIAPGAWGDLVLLDGNPLADIAAIRRVTCVIARGIPGRGCASGS